MAGRLTSICSPYKSVLFLVVKKTMEENNLTLEVTHGPDIFRNNCQDGNKRWNKKIA